MSAATPAAGGSAGRAHVWVTSMGGPLLVVPVSALTRWRGCTAAGAFIGGTETPDDYDRACAVHDLAGAIAVGDEGGHRPWSWQTSLPPAATCPGTGLSCAGMQPAPRPNLAAAAIRVLADPATAWQDYGTWATDGPAGLMDSANAGTDLGAGYPGGGLPDRALVPLPAATWRVRAVYAEADEHTMGRPGPPHADQPIRGAHAQVDEGVERLKT
jgi:Immunity protein 21